MKNKPLRLLILATFVIKCIIAGTTELNNDEVYYWAYAQHLQWNYFDHPPLVAILIRLFTCNLVFQQELFVRLGAIVCAAINTWLIYSIGKKIKDERTGLYAAILFSVSPYGSIIAGLLILPDASQLLCWLWSVWLMLQIVRQDRGRIVNRYLLLLGVAIGLSLLGKIHAAFLWIGFGGYVLLFGRKLLGNPYLYLSMLVTACLFLPVIYWNIGNRFITYTYHSNRIDFLHGVHWDSFFRELFGEILYNNPVYVTVLVLAIAALVREKWALSLPVPRLFLLIALPLMSVVIFLSLFADTLPHWTGPAYTTLIPLAAAWLAGKQTIGSPVPPVIKWAAGITMGLLVLALAAIHWLPLHVPNKDYHHLGTGDVTLDMSGWKQFGRQFDSLYRRDTVAGIMKKDAFLLADYWFPAAHIDYYAAKPAQVHFLAIGGLAAIHHYAWLNEERPFLHQRSDAYFIAISNYFNPPAQKLVAQFDSMVAPVMITQYRAGWRVRNFFVYRMKGYKGSIPRSGVLEGQ